MPTTADNGWERWLCYLVVGKTGSVTAYNGAREWESIVSIDVVERLNEFLVTSEEFEFLSVVFHLYDGRILLILRLHTQLYIRKDDFYRIENTVDGKTYCTARGWEDLSDAMRLYEENGYKVDDSLVLQYIRNKKIAHEFATYYDLYRKYRGDYETAAILNGTESAEVRRRAGRAAFDERVTLLSLLTDSVLGEIRASVREETALRAALPIFRDIRKEVAGGTKRPVVDSLKARREALEEAMARDKKSGALSSVQERGTLDLEDILEKAETQLRIQGLTQSSDGKAAFAWIRENFGARAAAMKDGADTAEKHLDNLFEFVNSAFGSGNEMLLLTTHLSVSRDAVKFLSGHRCDAYYKYAKKYEIYNREEELDRELDAIDIDSLGD